MNCRVEHPYPRHMFPGMDARLAQPMRALCSVSFELSEKDATQRRESIQSYAITPCFFKNKWKPSLLVIFALETYYFNDNYYDDYNTTRNYYNYIVDNINNNIDSLANIIYRK